MSCIPIKSLTNSFPKTLSLAIDEIESKFDNEKSWETENMLFTSKQLKHDALPSQEQEKE